MSPLTKLYALFSVLICLGACTTLGEQPLKLPTTLAPPDTAEIVQSGDLRIGPMDMLAISVFGVQDLGGDFQVDFEGRLKMPLIGEVPAKGLTALELSSDIEERLETSYLQDADVTVLIKETQGRIVTIEGSVIKPGLFPIQGKTTLLQAVALSGGPNEYANLERVVVFRQVDGQRTVAGFDLKMIRSGETADPEIFGNDIIVVDGSDFRRNYRDFVRAIPLIGLFLAL